MDRRKDPAAGSEGTLPALAPLANPYVPFQMVSPPKYEARTALVRGTLFPGLELPFMGMINKNEKPVTPKTELQVLAFAIQELALYLDTHPEDQEALELYRSYQQMYQKGAMEYAQKYGPLTHGQPISSDKYCWLNDPWPWEFMGNKEE